MVKKEIIEEVINDIINFTQKCREGSKGSSGVIRSRGDAPKFEYNDGNLENDELDEIADAMAERWGLEVSLDEKGNREISKVKFNLWDNEHNTLIRLGKIIKHQDWIDFTNNGNGNYDLDDVLRYYDELDELGKNRMGALLFETNGGSSMNRAYHGIYGIENTVEISNMVYGNKDTRGTNVPSEYHLKQVLGHEVGHASERVLTKEMVDVLRKASIPKKKNKLNRNRLTTDRERELYDNMIRSHRVGNANDISGSKEWRDAQDKNKVRMASAYASSYTTIQDRNSEDFAETMSAVSYRNTDDKSNFRITYNDGRTVGYDEFVRDHEYTFKLACDYVDGKIIHTDLHNPNNGEKFT